MKPRVYLKAFAGILGLALIGSVMIGVVSLQSSKAQNVTTIVVLDPGHGINETIIDPATGLNDSDSSNPEERRAVWNVAQKAKAKLEAAGYRVILTKNSEEARATLRMRAGVADSDNAALAVSIHGDPKLGNAGEIYVQKVGLYRGGPPSPHNKVTFNDAAVASKSQVAAQIFRQKRSEIEGGNIVIKDNSFNGRYPPVEPGNIPFILLVSKTPWVYNELKMPFNEDVYANSIVESIKAAVPLGTAGTAPTPPAGCSPEDNVTTVAPAKPGEKVPLGIAEQIGNFYQWVLGIGALIALGVLVFGGILYTTSAGNASRQDDAKQWGLGSVIGLLILFGSYLILNTINPELTKLKDLNLIVNQAAQNNNNTTTCSDAAQRVAEIAMAEYNAGVQEEPLESNTGPRVRQYLDAVGAGPSNPWCAAFVSWVFQQASAPLSCASAAAKELLKCGPQLTSPAVGAIAVFRTDDSDFNNDHAGIITEVRPDGSYVVINGNGGDEKGKDRVARDIVTRETTEKPIIVAVPGVTQ